MYCASCGTQIADGAAFCPKCGAAQNAAASPTFSENLKASVAPVDMSRLRAADEIEYEIFGDDMQLVEIALDPQEAVVAEAGAMAYMEDGIEMQTVFGDASGADEGTGFLGKAVSAGKRALTGESLFMTLFTDKASTKKKVAFAAPYPGKIIPVELKEFDNQVICQKSAFLCAAKGVSVDLFLNKKLGVGLFGGEGFIMEKIVGDGLVFFNAGGTIIKKELNDGETLRIDTGCLVAMDVTVNYDIQFASDIKSGIFGGEGLFLATLTGPGTVWLQSLPFSRLAATVVSKAGSNSEESNALGKTIGGLLKF